MDGNEYKKLCERTDSNISHQIPNRILHGALGCGTEAGELLDAVKRSIFYGQKLDRVNLIEELGDLAWYMSILMIELESSWEEVWTANIGKLKKRYPLKFDMEKALKRDLTKERYTLEHEILTPNKE